MSILLNDREEAACRLALQRMLDLHKEGDKWAGPLSREEVEELVHTMGPDSGKAFGIK